ncbi:MAG: PqqD family protein [Actinomycetota bacterium]
MTTEQPRVRQSPGALARSVGGEVLLAAPDREGVDVLSETAALVWSLLDRPRSLDELVDVLGERFAGSREAIARDVGSLVDDLVRRGFIEAVGQPDA